MQTSRATRPLPAHTDVAVVGGSSAGLHCAALLAQAGKQALVLERRPPDSRMVGRTMIVTPKYRSLMGEAGERAIVNEIRRFELVAGGTTMSFELSDPDPVIERDLLIDVLQERARDAGVAFATGTFEALTPASNSLGVQLLDGRSITARTVVAADGGLSRVRMAAGMPRLRTVPLIQAVVKRPEGLDEDTTRCWFRVADTPYFYWLIPDAGGTAVLGLIGEDPVATRAALKAFLLEQNLEPLDYQAARIPLYDPDAPIQTSLAGGDVWFVGDAAGHVKVSTVGGVVTGLRGAIGVAGTIAGVPPLSRELRGLRRELRAHDLVRRALHAMGDDDYERLLGRARSAFSAAAPHSRDEATRLLMWAAVRKPSLLSLGARALLKAGRARRQEFDAAVTSIPDEPFEPHVETDAVDEVPS